MAINEVTDLLVEQYTRRPSPISDESFRLFVSREFQQIEAVLKSLTDSAIQVADDAPDKPKKGMIRYAVSPWNPLGNGYQGLVVYNGTAWVQV